MGGSGSNAIWMTLEQGRAGWLIGKGLFLNRCQVLQVEQLAGLPAQHKRENDKDEPKRQNRPAWLENI